MKKFLLYLTLIFTIINYFPSCGRKKASLLEKLSFEYDKKYTNDYTNMFIIIDSVKTDYTLNIHVEKLRTKKEFLGTYYETFLTDGTNVTIKNYNKTFNTKNFISERLIKREGIENNLIFNASDDRTLSNFKYIHVTFDTLEKNIKAIQTFDFQ
ncbi:hypothetical protein [Paenimyroides aestuarii]|uniref:Lipoprotein n=1 Tax=Paenimyroides aestuarii TaxID=2968490 RepID=A0ABY5NU35_9FLAO|nr:hypothetical protein [Paenimyroides aestuarii]UUV22111.1 hypothetical protein NPX36_03440 [Paenimyroides aestuarii]